MPSPTRLLIPLAIAAVACRGGDATPGSADTGGGAAPAPLAAETLDALSMTRVKADVDLLAHDDFAGRTPGSPGHLAARDHIAGRMADIGLEPLADATGTLGGYALPFDLQLEAQRFAPDASGDIVETHSDTGYNLAGLLPGTDRPEEVIILMAHYDHLGTTTDGTVYNGAFDDITGAAALLELARVFVDEGVTFERSVLFLITDSEEGGLLGSEAWAADPLLSHDDVVFALSVDPLGRGLVPDVWPLILLGLERSPALQARWRDLAALSEVPVAFVNRAPIPVFGSDQDSFWEAPEPVPAIWFVSPGMTWYHTTDDTAETIDYRSVRAQLRFLAQVVAAFGDDTERFTDAGPQALTPRDLLDAAALLEAVEASTHLTDAERSKAGQLRARFEGDAAADTVSGEAQTAYLQSALFLLFDLTAAHPGEVPPPFPAE